MAGFVWEAPWRPPEEKKPEVWSLHEQAEGSSSPANFCYYSVQLRVYPNKLVLKVITCKYAWHRQLPQVSVPYRFHRHEMGCFHRHLPPEALLSVTPQYMPGMRTHFKVIPPAGLGQLWAHLMQQHSCVLILHPSKSTICSYCPIQ